MLNALIYTKIYQSIKYLSVAIISLLFMIYKIRTFKKHEQKVITVTEYVFIALFFSIFFYLFGGFVTYFSELINYLKISTGKIAYTADVENKLKDIVDACPYLYETLPLLFRKIFVLGLFWAIVSFAILLILQVIFAEKDTEIECAKSFLKNSWKIWLYSLIISIVAYWIIAILIIVIA